MGASSLIFKTADSEIDRHLPLQAHDKRVAEQLSRKTNWSFSKICCKISAATDICSAVGHEGRDVRIEPLHSLIKITNASADLMSHIFKKSRHHCVAHISLYVMVFQGHCAFFAAGLSLIRVESELRSAWDKCKEELHKSHTPAGNSEKGIEAKIISRLLKAETNA